MIEKTSRRHWNYKVFLGFFFWEIVFLLIVKSDVQAIHSNCATYIQKYEAHYGIPAGLLHAISKAESGRKDHTGRIVAWPWTINVEGKGYFFPTKQAAIKAVQKMQEQGIKSIDIGCMQVNLYHHPRAFKTLEDAFEPRHNVAYAAHFLANLKQDHNCWYKAVAHYHSANPIHYIPYQKTVLGIWNKDNKAGGIALAAELTDHYLPSPENHIRRLTKGKTLKLAKGNLTPVSNKTFARRGMMRGSNSHVRRLKLSSTK